MADVVCSSCGGPVRDINKHGVCTRTMACRRENARRRGSYVTHRLSYILRAARRRAKVHGVVFDLTLEDLPPVPDSCPILGIPLQVNIRTGSRASSPSLDRKDPSAGYVPDNVWWISHQANTMKSSADTKTLKKFAQWIMSMEETG